MSVQVQLLGVLMTFVASVKAGKGATVQLVAGVSALHDITNLMGKDITL